MVRQCLWKMSATTGACMHQTGFSSAAVMPQSKFTELCSSAAVLSHSKFTSCVTRQPLCHKVNLPRCEARRRHLTMTCDIFGTGQTNRRATSALWRIFAELNNRKLALSKMKLTSMEVSMFLS